MLMIRRILAAENDKRDLEPRDETYSDMYVDVVDANGDHTRRRIDKVRLHSVQPRHRVSWHN